MENTLNSRKREHIIVILCIFQMFIIKLRNWIILFKLARLLVTHNGGTPGGGALGHFLGGYVPPGTRNWHPVLEKISPKIDTPF